MFSKGHSLLPDLQGQLPLTLFWVWTTCCQVGKQKRNSDEHFKHKDKELLPVKKKKKRHLMPESLFNIFPRCSNMKKSLKTLPLVKKKKINLENISRM